MSYLIDDRINFVNNIKEHIKIINTTSRYIDKQSSIPSICNSAIIFAVKKDILEFWVKNIFKKLSFLNPLYIKSPYVLDMPILNISQQSLNSFPNFHIYTDNQFEHISNKIYYTCCWYERYPGYLPWKCGKYNKPIMYTAIIIPLNAEYYVISIFSTYKLSINKCINYIDKKDIIKINEFYHEEANSHFRGLYLGGFDQSKNYSFYTGEKT